MRKQKLGRRVAALLVTGVLCVVAAGCGGDDEPAVAGATVEEGRIADVVYVGAVTRYRLELDAGGELTVVSQNLEGGSNEVLERQGRRVRASWLPSHAFDIEETGSNGGEDR